MNQNASDDVRPEYDFSNAVQGKHHRAYKEGTNVVLLEPDVARVFRDSDSVNRALRLLMEIARDQTPEKAPSKITGIEILRASDRLNLDTILSYTLELDQSITKKKAA